MPVNADNVLGFGSDDDSLYLGAYDPDLGTKITGLTTAIPNTLVDCGWMSDDGVKITMDDSVTKVKGHQGHGVVRTFMDSSETGLEVALLESQLGIVTRYLNATATKIHGADRRRPHEDRRREDRRQGAAEGHPVLRRPRTSSTRRRRGDNPTRIRIVLPPPRAR